LAVACEARDETRSPVTRHSAVEATYFVLPLGAQISLKFLNKNSIFYTIFINKKPISILFPT